MTYAVMVQRLINLPMRLLKSVIISQGVSSFWSDWRDYVLLVIAISFGT